MRGLPSTAEIGKSTGPKFPPPPILRHEAQDNSQLKRTKQRMDPRRAAPSMKPEIANPQIGKPTLKMLLRDPHRRRQQISM